MYTAHILLKSAESTFNVSIIYMEPTLFIVLVILGEMGTDGSVNVKVGFLR